MKHRQRLIGIRSRTVWKKVFFRKRQRMRFFRIRRENVWDQEELHFRWCVILQNRNRRERILLRIVEFLWFIQVVTARECRSILQSASFSHRFQENCRMEEVPLYLMSLLWECQEFHPESRRECLFCQVMYCFCLIHSRLMRSLTEQQQFPLKSR